MKKKILSLNKQRGQAAVFVILFSAILLVAALSLYKTGKITTNKMQLQNAADAAAYSMSVVEARDLNFASYMNRAIVANEVGIAQFVGLASWAFHFQSFASYLGFYNNCCFSPATLGGSNAFIQPVVSAWQGPGNTAVRLMSKLANVATVLLHNINKIYGIAEIGYHTVSVLLAVGVLDDVIKQNGPPGAKISDFGVISLLSHIATYGVLPGLPGDQFASGYRPSQSIDATEFEESGYARLAALIRDSRDPFTTVRDWRIPLIPDIHITTPEVPPLWVDLGVIAWESGFQFDLTFGLERKGGSELRILLPNTSKVKPGEGANWSSADTTGLAMTLFIEGYIRLYILPEPFRQKIFDGRLAAQLGGGNLTFYADFTGADPVDPSDCEDANQVIRDDNAANGTNNPENDCSATAPPGKEILKVPFPNEIPFANGFAEVSKTTSNDIKMLKHMGLAPLGPIEGEMYGKAGQNIIAWMFPGTGLPVPAPPTGIYFSSDAPAQPVMGTKVSKAYGGLPMYVDTTGNAPFLGVGAPNVLLGLVQDEADFDTYYLAKTNLEDDYTTANSREPSGRLQVNEAFADQELAVLSKSELYFSRPTDIFASHFHRDDGLTEVGSAFNPYWQARLVDTNYPERLLALGIQQKEDYVNIAGSANTLVGKFDQLMSFISGLMPSIP
ncbi:MAG: hypothetical protein DHS20C09_10610 [marine bacterium B5-7]|nr:MAG: hypothetical protein DHS20C09_10610 [marine bacterium B5-7]